MVLPKERSAELQDFCRKVQSRIDEKKKGGQIPWSDTAVFEIGLEITKGTAVWRPIETDNSVWLGD